MNAKTPNPKTAITMATSVIFMLFMMATTPSWATDGDAVQTNQNSQNSTTAQKADEFFELAVRYDQASDYPMAVREYQKAAELGHYERCIIWRLPIFKAMALSKIIKRQQQNSGFWSRVSWAYLMGVLSMIILIN